jgi:hypothetical protein
LPCLQAEFNMQITIETENCDFQNFYCIEESADSSIKIRLDFQTIVSRQSRKEVIDGLIKLIHRELNKFEWIIIGSVVVDFLWYLNAVERQETDKVGDLDNISKPIQDALLGPSGILVDDSQIGGLYTYWQSRNNLVADNILYITIKFNNDYVLLKKDLKFIQYNKAICLPVNIETTSIHDLILAKILIKSRLQSRKAAKKIKLKGADVDRYFVCSEYDFHRTRLNAFPTNQIMTLEQLNLICISSGLTFKQLRRFFSLTKSQ